MCGPFRATGLRPALRTLRAIFAEVKVAEPDIHDRLGTAGVLCARFVRGSTSSISNHSWGTAIDLTIDGVLDTRGDVAAQKGLLRIHKHFNNHSFYWGAAFPVEDAMHFEASDQGPDPRMAGEWRARRPHATRRGDRQPAQFGDRGAEVVALQVMLSQVLRIRIAPDGIFGPVTHASVLDFQARNELAADGIVGRKTLAALRKAVQALG